MEPAYERAAAAQAHIEDKWVLNQTVHPRWIDASTLWYQRQTPGGSEYTLVDAERREKRPAFDHNTLAASLAKATGKEIDAAELPMTGTEIDATAVTFTAFGRFWKFEDGEPFYAYAANPNATGRPAIKPEAVWSPDSRYLFTAQTDDRQVRSLPVLDFAPADGSIRPRVIDYRQALPGDDHVTRFRMTVIDTETGKQTPLHYPHLAAVRMNDTPFGGNRAWWSADSTAVFFVDILRGEREARVITAARDSGQTRELFRETTDTYLELGSNVYMPTFIVPLPESGEFVWYSEKSGWGHLYLHDAESGEERRALTSGDWVVRRNNDNGAPVIEVIQGGLTDPAKALSPVPHEATDATGIRHLHGTLSLGRTTPGSASGAAFFITIGDQPSLDFGGARNQDGLGFAAFGRVTAGMDVVQGFHQMESTAPTDNAYLTGQLLNEPVTITRAYRQP